ncbi:calcium-activated chloride channel-domain-containing protein [Cantharellus anzutake]|uniref:calcium-activated chloride channel-domain-containing protein n=1 Tax=Cantharellus anzutake TaxID=1750568 RepID=UPI001902D2C7|nr:calcium-activated chloride channel-domain-containing protein [Cantharellus anzutake]KAF8333092.1 calcium-activated chloride channel-domain-containing protein [Cantharellus anzutake]
MKWEKSTGLPSAMSPTLRTPATKYCALYSYVTSPTSIGGLGIFPSADWPHIQGVVVRHPEDFRQGWLRWIGRPVPSLAYSNELLDSMAQQYGVDVALYFAFLSSSLVSGESLFRPYFSISVIVWSLLFVEGWKRRQHQLTRRWNAASDYIPPDLIVGSKDSPWWKTELKTALSLPLIGMAVLFVGFNMTVAFILEAFVMRMYNGPFQSLASLVPTIYNIFTTPPFVAIYSGIAAKLVSWEAHPNKPSHDASLLFKVAPVNAMVAPVSEAIHAAEGMTSPAKGLNAILPKTTPHTRLSEQLFSFTFVLQLAPLVAELLIPLALRWYSRRKNGPKRILDGGKGPAVVERIAFEASLPERNIFVALKKRNLTLPCYTAYPLTPALILFLSMIRLRADALKLLVHYRYTPSSHSAAHRSRVWASAWSVIIWFSALVNVALIAILDPFMRAEQDFVPKLTSQRPSSIFSLSYVSDAKSAHSPFPSSLASGAVTVLLASYAVILLKGYVAHLLRSRAHASLESLVDDVKIKDVPQKGSALSEAFWAEDEGNSEIWKKAI